MDTPTPPDTPSHWGNDESVYWRTGWKAGWKAGWEAAHNGLPDGLISTLGPNNDLTLSPTVDGFLVAGRLPDVQIPQSMIAREVIKFVTAVASDDATDDITDLSDNDSLHITSSDPSVASLLWAAVTSMVLRVSVA